MKANLEQLRLKIGTNIPILESKIDPYKDILLTESWTKSTWEFCSRFDITIQDHTQTVPLLREQDVCLM